MSSESPRKIAAVVLGVCFVCSLLVSITVVSLRAKEEQNKKLDKLENILIAGDLETDKAHIQETFEKNIKPIIIDLSTGEDIPEDQYNEILNPEDFDLKAIANKSEYMKVIPSKKDLAHIKKMPKYMAVYKVMKGDEVEKYILPIYGKGLWSTLYGFIALDKDLRTIDGFTFYEHGETPGLGGEVDNPRWKNIWKGKLAFDENWNVKIRVIKGKVNPAKPDAKYMVDGLSGSTLTTRGVDHLVRFWMGENGYGPFFKRLREEGTNEKLS